MAEIDASIPLGIRPVQIEQPLNQLAKLLQVQNMQQDNALSGLKMDEYQRGTNETNALNRLYQSSVKSDGSIDRNALFTGAAQQGLGSKIPGLQKGFVEQDQAQAKVDTEKFKLAKERHDYFRSTLGVLAQEPNLSKDLVVQVGQHLVQQGILPPEMFQQSMGTMPEDPQQLRARLIQGLKAQMTPEQIFTVFAPKATEVSNGQQKFFRDTNPNSPTYGQPTAGAPVQMQMTPGETASNQLGYSRLGEEKRHNTSMEGFRSQEVNGAEQQFTPDAIDNAAARYNIDGTLPPMGMGKAGAMGRSAILNRAAELAAGVDPQEQRITQIGNKANTASLAKLQQQQTMVGAFERNFVKNADIALELSQRVDRTGMPLANKWINAGKRAIAGDPELAAFDQAIKSASNEYAKIISGSMGNTAVAEGEIKKIEGLLNSAQTPEQVLSVVNLMKRETANRMAGFEEEKAALVSSMRRGGGGHGARGGTPNATAPQSRQVQKLPPNPTPQSLGVGQTYQLPNGKSGRWNGQAFEVVQ